MKVRVEVKNDILGNSVFWEGSPEKADEVRNIVAKNLVKQIAKDGKPRREGMWFVSKIA